MTQGDICPKMGVDGSYIRICVKVAIKTDTFNDYKLAKALGVSVDELLK